MLFGRLVQVLGGFSILMDGIRGWGRGVLEEVGIECDGRGRCADAGHSALIEGHSWVIF